MTGASTIERTIMYVDGFNLYHGLHDWSGRAWLWLDLVKLGEVLRPRSQIVKVHYFTAHVQHASAQARQVTYLRALKAMHGSRIEITLGRFQAEDQECGHCQETFTLFKEKESDVNLATQLVADAAAKAFDSALIVSADSDLIPAARHAKRIHPAAFVTAAMPPMRHSVEMKTAMPATFSIGKARVKEAQLPDAVPNPVSLGQNVYRRPQRWS